MTPAQVRLIASMLTEDPDVLAAPEQQEIADRASAIAGDDTSAELQVRKQLKQQQQLKDKQQQRPKQDTKQALQQLSSMEWNPSDTRFQHAAASVLAGSARAKDHDV